VYSGTGQRFFDINQPLSDFALFKVGEIVASRFDEELCITAARPKSSTLTNPCGVTFTLAGFKSRWTIPFSCAASGASAICLARCRAVSTGSGPWSVSPGTSFHHQSVLFDSVGLRNIWIIQGRELLGFALEAGQQFHVLCESLGEGLDCYFTIKFDVARPIDLPNAPCADRGEDLVRIRNERREPEA
jgi:hypothetical protein